MSRTDEKLAFKTWEPVKPILPKPEIISTEWGNKKISEVHFHPSYFTEGKPDMYKLITMAYARQWYEERCERDKHKLKVDVKLIRQKAWKTDFNNKLRKLRLHQIRIKNERMKLKAERDLKKAKEEAEILEEKKKRVKQLRENSLIMKKRIDQKKNSNNF